MTKEKSVKEDKDEYNIKLIYYKINADFKL